MSNKVKLKQPEIKAPQNAKELLKLVRELGHGLEEVLGQVMAYADEESAKNVSTCLSNAQVRLVECIDWVTHAVAHAHRGE